GRDRSAAGVPRAVFERRALREGAKAVAPEVFVIGAVYEHLEIAVFASELVHQAGGADEGEVAFGIDAFVRVHRAAPRGQLAHERRVIVERALGGVAITRLAGQFPRQRHGGGEPAAGETVEVDHLLFAAAEDVAVRAVAVALKLARAVQDAQRR